MLTWDNVSCIKHVFIFNEAKAIHELDFLDDSSTMALEMILDFLFGD